MDDANVDLITSLVGKNPGIISSLLTGLFEQLDKNGILWAVMRGWERLPEWTRYDVDILVRKSDVFDALRIATEVGARNGWVHYGQLDFGDMRSAWFLKDNGGQSYLRLDFITGFSYRGISAMNTDADLQMRIWTDKGFWRMPDGHAGAIVLLKQILTHGEVDSETRKTQVLKGVKEDGFNRIVCATVGEKLGGILVECARREDWDGIKKLATEVKRYYFRFTPLHLLQMSGYVFRVVEKLIFPYLHCLVVLIGPDGCGKTTVGDAIEARFMNRPFTSIKRIRMNFGMPRLRNIFALLVRCIGIRLKHKEEPKPGSRHMGMHRPHSMFRSMVYVVYYGVGMLIGRLKLFFWRAFSGLVIADRYFYDYYYMRGYVNCPHWFIRIFEIFAPSPDLVFVLNRPAADIYAQKPELTVEEIKRQQDAIMQVFGCRKNVRIIDASHGVECTVNAANREIEKWLISH